MSFRIDERDDAIRRSMAGNHVPGLSVTIFRKGHIVESPCYGVCDVLSKVRTIPGTMFQAGSISKFVASILSLRLVEMGFLNLDEDLSSKLTSWAIKFDFGV